MKNEEQQNDPSKIPADAFKPAVCKCGNDIFVVGQRFMFYPGGLYSKAPVAAHVPGTPMLICTQCHQPFENMVGSLETTEPKKKGVMKKLFGGK